MPSLTTPPLVEVLGPGCARCQETYRVISEAANALGSTAPIEKVESFDRMAALGVLATPAIAVGGRVILSGRVPTPDEARTILCTLDTPSATPDAPSGDGCTCNGKCA